MQPRRVDFPAPLGPIRHVSEPAATSSETSSTALTAPNAFMTPESSQATSRAGSDASGRDAAATRFRLPETSDAFQSLGEPPAEVANRSLDHVEERGAILLRKALEHGVLELGDGRVAFGEYPTTLCRERRGQRSAV